MEKIIHEITTENLKQMLKHHIRTLVPNIYVLIKCLTGEEGYRKVSAEKIKEDIDGHITAIEQLCSVLRPEDAEKIKQFLEIVKVPENPNQNHETITHDAFGEIENLLKNI